MKTAVQMYSLRDYIGKEGLKKVLENISKAGYDGVEFAGDFGGYEAKELKKILDELKIEAMGAHVGLDVLEDGRFLNTMEFLREIGVKYVIVPYINLAETECKEGIKRIKEALKKAEKEGFETGYHNHSFEFEGGDFVKELTNEGIKWEADIFWVKAAGKDVTKYLKEMQNSLTLLHIKEMGKGGVEAPNPVVGQGISDSGKAMELGKKLGLEYAILEAENLDMPYEKYLAKSCEFMKKYC